MHHMISLLRPARNEHLTINKKPISSAIHQNHLCSLPLPRGIPLGIVGGGGDEE